MSGVKYDEVEVASKSYRIAHALSVILYTLLVVSGLNPRLFDGLAYAVGAPLAAALGLPLFFVAREPGRVIHMFLGVSWGLFLAAYGAYLLAFRRVRMFDALRKPIGQQVREASAFIKHYLLGKPLPEDVAKSLERHNVLATYLTIILLIGLAISFITGALMAYGNALGLSESGYEPIEETHESESEFGSLKKKTKPERGLELEEIHELGFRISLIFVVPHLFAVLHPSNRPLLVAMFGKGKVPLEWAQKHMPRFLSRVQRG